MFSSAAEQQLDTLQATGSSPVTFTKQHAGIAQLVEHLLAKQDVESSSLFARSNFVEMQVPD